MKDPSDFHLFSLQSYWDWLPPEIQEYIIRLATAQYIRDNRQNTIRNNVHKELLLCAKLNSAWECQHAKLVWETFPVYHHINGVLHTVEFVTSLYGCQYENGTRIRKMWLGHEIENALRNLPRLLQFNQPE